MPVLVTVKVIAWEFVEEMARTTMDRRSHLDPGLLFDIMLSFYVGPAPCVLRLRRAFANKIPWVEKTDKLSLKAAIPPASGAGHRLAHAAAGGYTNSDRPQPFSVSAAGQARPENHLSVQSDGRSAGMRKKIKIGPSRGCRQYHRDSNWPVSQTRHPCP